MVWAPRNGGDRGRSGGAPVDFHSPNGLLKPGCPLWKILSRQCHQVTVNTLVISSFSTTCMLSYSLLKFKKKTFVVTVLLREIH